MAENLKNLSLDELRSLRAELIQNHDKPEESSSSSLGKYAAMIPRSLAAAPGYLSDFVNLPLNLLGRAAHKVAGVPYQEHPGHGEQTKQVIDKTTKDYAKPTTKGEKIYEAALDVVGPGKTKAAKTIVGKIGKTAASRVPQMTGAAIGEATDSPGEGLAATIALSGIGKKGKQLNFQKLSDNATLSRLKRNPDLKKKVIEELSEEAHPKKFGNVPNEVAGQKTLKSAENYKKKSEKAFGNIFNRSESHINNYISGKNNPKSLINPDKAIDYGIQKLTSVNSPTLKTDWLGTAAGKQFKQLLKLRGETGGIHVRDAEGIRRAIGNKTSQVGAMGNLEAGQLRHISGLLKSEIGEKYKEAASHARDIWEKSGKNTPKPKEINAFRNWERSNDHYTLHKEKNTPKVNEILKLKHEPEEAFTYSMKGIGKGATKLKHVLQYSKGKDKRTYGKGVVFELGKKDQAWDAPTFYKNFNEIPSKNKKLILNSLSKKEAIKLKKLGEQLKTMESIGGKKSGLDIASEFVPRGIKKIIHPIQEMRYNNYLNPKQVSIVTKAIKEKAHPTLEVKKDRKWTELGIMPMVSKHSNNLNDRNDLNNLSMDELREMKADLLREHHMEGDSVGNSKSTGIP